MASHGTPEKQGESAQVLLSSACSGSNSSSFSCSLVELPFAFILVQSRVCVLLFLSTDEVLLLLRGDLSAPIEGSADFLVEEGMAKEEVTSESLSPSLNSICPAR